MLTLLYKLEMILGPSNRYLIPLRRRRTLAFNETGQSNFTGLDSQIDIRAYHYHSEKSPQGE